MKKAIGTLKSGRSGKGQEQEAGHRYRTFRQRGQKKRRAEALKEKS